MNMKIKMDGHVMTSLTCLDKARPYIHICFQGPCSYVETLLLLEVLVVSMCKMHIKLNVDMNVVNHSIYFLMYRRDFINIYNHLLKPNY
jgi:hypothetical protein